MKVTVLQENLSRGLSTVSRAVSSRSTLPVLANILIATDEGRLRLSATNLELGITCWIGAKIEEEGSTTVPARTLSDLVSTMPDPQVLLTLDSRTQTLNLCSGASTDRKAASSSIIVSWVIMMSIFIIPRYRIVNRYWHIHIH